MNQPTIRDKFSNLFFTKSIFVSTFIIYITILFISIVSFIELRKNIIPDVTLNFLFILELHVIFNFILTYIGLFNSIKLGKWINSTVIILFFIMNMTLLYQTLSTLITQTSSFIVYATLLTITSGSMYLQNYIDDKKAKSYLLLIFVLSALFLAAVYILNYIFVNSFFSANQFLISQKQVNDFLFLSSIMILVSMLYSLFNILRVYIPDIKNIDQKSKSE
jgi:hypothetical protein